MFFRPLYSVTSHCCLVLTLFFDSCRGRHDERSHGPMYVPRGSDHPSEEEGGGEGLKAEGVDGLEGCLDYRA